MARLTRPVPEGYHTITPQLVVRDGAAAIEFYQRAFGAREVSRQVGPDGKLIMHAELRIGDSPLFVVDESPDWGTRSPRSLGDTPVTIQLYVEDADALFDRATKAGAQVTMPLADQFWGDRYGMVLDPFGHSWAIATRVEELSQDEIRQRMAEATQG